MECPKNSCSYETDTEMGLKIHYGQSHDDPYPDNVYECVNCGESFTASPSERTEYCSHKCYSKDSKGVNKGFGGEKAAYRDEEWLRTQIEEEERDVFEIADEFDVGDKTIRKWKNKFEIGLDYECPSCDKKFSSLRGRNAHHTQVHGESIRGSEYECEWCGETFTDRRSPEHNNPPKYCKRCYGKHMEGENNPNKDPERQEKISQGLLDSYANGERKPTGRKTTVVEETGHNVDSGWEAEVDRLLYSVDVDYEYNGHGEYKQYHLASFTHAPDFVIESEQYDVVIEVKGGKAVYHQGDKMKRISELMTERDDVFYILYGDVP